MSPTKTRSRFYQEMRLRHVLRDVDLINDACNWQAPSIVCNERQLKARVIWRELMHQATAIEISLGF